MKILCASNMPLAKEAFRTLGDVTLKEGRQIGPGDVRDAELLAIRSTTKVNEALLSDSPVRFVGTATIGTDHLDIPYLDQKGVEWVSSAGCNAISVAEFITAALLEFLVTHNRDPRDMTLGVIGVGHVGSKVARQGEALGMKVLLNDPPRARAEGQDGFVKLDELLAASDVVTMHVPLTKDGEDPTFQMCDQAFFGKLKAGAWFMNAARGPIMDTRALCAARNSGTIGALLIDTWENEPVVADDLLQLCDFATPACRGLFA